MKRAGNLINSIADVDNLYLAWTKARRGKATKQNVIEFEKNLDKNILDLREGILSGNVPVGEYNYFTIYDPKVRRICAAAFPERVLHHALMNICETYFERHLIFHSYATRKNKGTYAALDTARFFNKKNKFFVKLDVRKYFDSISHNKLKQLLRRLFKDKTLLTIFDRIIDSYSVEAGRGLPIGNLTSQFFANYYLSFADHYAKEQLRIKYYVRYMDDIVFWGDDKNELNFKTLQFKNYIKDFLLLDLKPAIIDKTKNGLPFLGYKLFPYYVRLNRRSKLRFKKKIKQYYKKFGNETDLKNHLMPLMSFVLYADTRKLREKVLKELR